MLPLHTLDYLDEILNVEASKAERWIMVLRLADEITDHEAGEYQAELSRRELTERKAVA